MQKTKDWKLIQTDRHMEVWAKGKKQLSLSHDYMDTKKWYVTLDRKASPVYDFETVLQSGFKSKERALKELNKWKKSA